MADRDRAGPSARDRAFDILRRVDREGAYSSVLLESVGDDALSRRDTALLTEIVYGVLRRRLRLDAVIAAHASRSPEAIDADLLLVLRIAAYQILYLDRVPAHAAVDEAVSMARRVCRPREASAAFANGVLRAVARGKDALETPSDPSIAESHPRWMIRRWTDRHGPEGAARLAAANNRPAPRSLRVNTTMTTRDALARDLEAEGLRLRPSDLVEGFLILEEGVAARTAAFSRGAFYIQDEASGLVASLAGASRGDRVYDACAAPGGKALAIAEKVGEEGWVVAGDLHPSRLRLLADNARRMGLARCFPVAIDAVEPLPFAESLSFDIVIVDAPCSGTGVIRRHPELRYRLDESDPARLAALQRDLLARACRRVRRGGVLLYAVCSLEPEEGGDTLAAFIAAHPGFVVEDPRPFMTVGAARQVVTEIPAGAVVMTRPDRDGMDGFFAARLRCQR